MDQREDLYRAQNAAKDRAAAEHDAAVDQCIQGFPANASNLRNTKADSRGILGACAEARRPAVQDLLISLSKGSEEDRILADRKQRAITILMKHPEFEDFIWLLRSGLI